MWGTGPSWSARKAALSSAELVPSARSAFLSVVFGATFLEWLVPCQFNDEISFGIEQDTVLWHWIGQNHLWRQFPSGRWQNGMVVTKSRGFSLAKVQCVRSQVVFICLICSAHEEVYRTCLSFNFILHISVHDWQVSFCRVCFFFQAMVCHTLVFIFWGIRGLSGCRCAIAIVWVGGLVFFVCVVVVAIFVKSLFWQHLFLRNSIWSVNARVQPVSYVDSLIFSMLCFSLYVRRLWGRCWFRSSNCHGAFGLLCWWSVVVVSGLLVSFQVVVLLHMFGG